MANQQRDPRKEHFWRQHLQCWQRSSLTIRDYCAQHHLSEPSFYAWRRMLAERDQHAHATVTTVTAQTPPAERVDPPAFVAVQLAAAATPLELLLNDGVIVRVPAGFDADTLRRLLQTLRSQPC
jgi:hypothetical protein